MKGLKILIIVTLIAVPSILMAAQLSQGCNVSAIRPRENSRTIVILDCDSTGAEPSCVAHYDRYVINTATSGGKSLFVHLQIAKIEESTVTIWGAGSCDTFYSNIESIKMVQ